MAQQPSYNANLNGYVGWLIGTDLATKKFVSIRLVPTVGPGIVAAWAPTRIEDSNVNVQLSNALAILLAPSTSLEGRLVP